MVDLGKINMMVKDQGRVIKISTLRPCDGHEDSSWRSLLSMKKPKYLMHFVESVCHFDEILFEGVGFSPNAFVLWLLCLTTPLSVTTKFGLCQHLHQPMLELFFNGVCKSRLNGDWIFLNAKKVNRYLHSSSLFSFLYKVINYVLLPLCVKYVQGEPMG